MKELVEDFIREFSVWQQQIEVEANLGRVKEVLGIPCSEFLFVNFKDGRVTAFRIKEESENIQGRYLELAKNDGFGQKLFELAKPLVDRVKSNSKIFSEDIAQVGSTELMGMRQDIIKLWPAYLFGYNVCRFEEKAIFVPQSRVEKENLNWAMKIRLYSEGIYDSIESIIDKKLKDHFWQLLSTKEIGQLFDNGVDQIPNRKLPFIVDQTGLTDSDFESYLKQNNYYWNQKSDKNISTEIKGMVAFRGKASGRVRLVSKRIPESFENFKDGDILVALATSPQFVPLMKRASAIVTDEGGLTSHAAIVARELKVPCIVATKTATKVLHDGDLIEVDTESGVVRQI